MATDQNGNDLGIILDPMMYIGLATRDESGRVRTLRVIYDDESVEVKEDGMEFFTFHTQVLLEEPPVFEQDED